MIEQKGKTLIIAEAGVNHNGSLDRALELVDVAADAGADIVKFQTFKADKLAAPSAKMAAYQKTNMGQEQSQQAMLKSLELSYEAHYKLIEHCEKKNIHFLSTAFEFESLEFLLTLKMGLWKIPSGEITNLPYLEWIAQRGEPVIISTGMADFAEVNTAVQALLQAGQDKKKLTVLHCNTEYPTPMVDVNLRAMAKMGQDLGLAFGYSDHTMGIEIPIAAVALGATIIEKHFTLSQDLPGPDHKASLEPRDLTLMIKAIRNIESALGTAEKRVSASENKNREVARKSIIAKVAIQKGELLTEKNLDCARPGSGMSPMLWHKIQNRPAQKSYEAGDLLQEII